MMGRWTTKGLLFAGVLSMLAFAPASARAEQGDCDDVSHCQSGLVCRDNNGPAFQWNNWVDVCVRASFRRAA